MSQICNLWSNANTQWKSADWLWKLCKTAAPTTCTLWSSTSTQWKSADWLWKRCKTTDTCSIWEQTFVSWERALWNWEECSGSIQPIIVPTIVFPGGVDATTLIQPWMLEEEPWDAYKEVKRKKKSTIVVVCKIDGKSYNEEKERKDIKMSVNEVDIIPVYKPNIGLTMKR